MVTWIVDGQLAASSLADAADAELLAESGIGAVLSLTESSPFPDGPPYGIAHLHLPVGDFTAPTLEELDRAVRFLRAQIVRGRRALVHCWAGLGRTGTVIACYLVAEGLAPGDAIRLVRSARPGSVETGEQEDAVRGYRPPEARGDD